VRCVARLSIADSQCNAERLKDILSGVSLERLPKDASRYPFRASIVSVSRLFLVHALAHMSAEERTEIGSNIQQAQYPSHMAAMYGPKIVSRPADLSPGEYETVAQLFPMVFVPFAFGNAALEPEIKRWESLSVMLRCLWNAQVA
jgi:hypothetical protein